MAELQSGMENKLCFVCDLETEEIILVKVMTLKNWTKFDKDGCIID